MLLLLLGLILEFNSSEKIGSNNISPPNPPLFTNYLQGRLLTVTTEAFGQSEMAILSRLMGYQFPDTSANCSSLFEQCSHTRIESIIQQISIKNNQCSLKLVILSVFNNFA